MAYEQFGGAGDALLWKNETAKPETMARVGQFRPRTCPEGLRTIASACGVSVRRLRENWKVVVGIARLMAAEILSDDTDDADAIADALLFKISNGKPLLPTSVMSITDIDNCELSYQLIEEAARISREGWLVAQQEAEYLIASAAK
ncbi:hypothetical protein [Paraburkholderia azotifigens]|uniref:Uncharacterized protein n=1 Tax=Paraburkholderia azotifigens TaxID=2057004 RepID=A0ABU9QVM6_9BURK